MNAPIPTGTRLKVIDERRILPCGQVVHGQVIVVKRYEISRYLCRGQRPNDPANLIVNDQDIQIGAVEVLA